MFKTEISKGIIYTYEKQLVKRMKKEYVEEMYNPTPEQWNFMARRWVAYDVPVYSYEWILVNEAPYVKNNVSSEIAIDGSVFDDLYEDLVF
jgi:hypothetical protein